MDKKIENDFNRQGLDVCLKRLGNAKSEQDAKEWLQLIDEWYEESKRMYKKKDNIAKMEQAKMQADNLIPTIKDNWKQNQFEVVEPDENMKYDIKFRDLLWNIESEETLNELRKMYNDHYSERQLEELKCQANFHLEEPLKHMTLDLYYEIKNKLQ